MNEANRKILNDLPLVEVMRGWGYVPRSSSKALAWYICPWHDDHRPSFSVDKSVREGAQDLGFKCWAGRDGHEGYGAIQLAAQLMGLPIGPVPAEQMDDVLNELATRCDVELEPEDGDGDKKAQYNKRSGVTGWDDFCKDEPQYGYLTDGQAEFEPGEWTEEGLKALGLKVELATRMARKSDITELRNNDSMGATAANASAGGEIGAPHAAEIRIGDTITEITGDGEPLYRCSLGRDFYRGAQKAETRTIKAWGEELQQVFGVEPIGRFLLRKRLDDGCVIVISVRATKNYPMFIFRYGYGVKKYEPKSRGTSKWTWWNKAEDADLDHQWYGDAALKDFLEDGVIPQEDGRHPVKVVEDEEKKQKRYLFERVIICSGPRDAINTYAHSNAHVVWLHSEQAGFNHKDGSVRPNRWLRSLLKKLQTVTVDGGLYVCYDEDATGLAASQAIALNSPNIHWLRLPKELKPLKDVTDFITRFDEVERLMPADLQHDDPVEWFDNALFDTPTTKFWQWESERKEQDGSGRARYKFDLRNTPVFLRARGMVRKTIQGEKGPASRFFILGNDNIYTELFPGEKGTPNKLVQQSREMMADWLRAHKEYNDQKGALSRSIFSAKLEQSTLEAIELMDFDEKSYGEDFDHFFFKDGAVRVTKGEVRQIPYSQMSQWTCSEAILDGEFTYIRQQWRVTLSPFYEAERLKHEELLRGARTSAERQQENMRWDTWESLWKYKLVTDKPLDEMPMHFRFLYNTCRIFWEKEETGELSATEKQAQDMYFITMLHAIGSALVRHRSANRQQFLHITDNGTRREDLASGGTGKTAILELLGLLRRTLNIDGKSLEGGNIVIEQELGKIVPGLHNIVCIDELPQGFSPKKMYNYPLSVTSRGLYRGSVKLEGDDLPKFVLASNEQMDLSSDSTIRRVYQVLVSDWYHPKSMDGSRPAHTPADDFYQKYHVKEVARNLPPTLLNEARNLLIGCVQLFMQMPDETLRPPRDSRALLRQALAASKDEQFTLWISDYLKDKRHIGIPIAQRELAISLLDYSGSPVGEKTLKAAYKRIRDNLGDYLKTSVYVVDPPVVLLTDTDRSCHYRQCAAWQYPRDKDGYSIPLDEQGNRVPRELKMCKRVYYFYLKSRIPFHQYSEEHIGEKDYVQPAPEKDPEEMRNVEVKSERL